MTRPGKCPVMVRQLQRRSGPDSLGCYGDPNRTEPGAGWPPSPSDMPETIVNTLGGRHAEVEGPHVVVPP